MTSKELKWCNNFRRAMHYRWKGKNHRVRKKNHHRAMRLMIRAFDKWSSFPYPPEWREKDERNQRTERTV